MHHYLLNVLCLACECGYNGLATNLSGFGLYPAMNYYHGSKNILHCFPVAWPLHFLIGSGVVVVDVGMMNAILSRGRGAQLSMDIVY